MKELLLFASIQQQAEALFRNKASESELSPRYNSLIKEIINSSLIESEAHRIVTFLPATKQTDAINKINPQYQSKLRERMNSFKNKANKGIKTKLLSNSRKYKALKA
ncbi:MAG: hypothetical protein K0R14_795 [Burkholderiales bacterium]|jgi:hypothetical protein|nr:hypothetical protein [Burkholderiales bacterium]